MEIAIYCIMCLKEVLEELKMYLVVGFIFSVLALTVPYTPLLLFFAISGMFVYVHGRHFSTHDEWKMLNWYAGIVALLFSVVWIATDLIYASNLLGRYVWWHAISEVLITFGLIFYFGYLGYFVHYKKLEWWELPLLFVSCFFVVGLSFIMMMIQDALTMWIFVKMFLLAVVVYVPVELLIQKWKKEHIHLYYSCAVLWSVLSMILFLGILVWKEASAVGLI